LAARRAIQVPGVKIIGLDNSQQMVERCQALVAEDNSAVPVEILFADITKYPFERAGLFLMYFTLQFVAPGHRSSLLKRIYEALEPGGMLVLAEKLRFDDPNQQTWMETHHLAFKRSQGYSDLEIAKKRQAIENVLIPQSGPAHIDALHQAGFQQVYRWFQSLNFASFVAIKQPKEAKSS
jgi:tRNA (cmo5U34)-methyltransferase